MTTITPKYAIATSSLDNEIPSEFRLQNQLHDSIEAAEDLFHDAMYSGSTSDIFVLVKIDHTGVHKVKSRFGVKEL